jgi:hypothetical protein
MLRSNPADRFFEVEVYAVGGRRGIILIPEGREGRGWSRFATELGKVIVFFIASVGSRLVPSSSVLRKTGKLVEPGLVQRYTITGGTGLFGKDLAPSYAEVLLSAASPSEAEKTMGRSGEPLGKDRCA